MKQDIMFIDRILHVSQPSYYQVQAVGYSLYIFTVNKEKTEIYLCRDKIFAIVNLNRIPLNKSMELRYFHQCIYRNKLVNKQINTNDVL